MARCNTCGNEYEHSFEVNHRGHTYSFDCFECAIQMLAPTCENCGVRILGHGTQAGGRMFCCSHCAREQGIEGIQTHV